MHTVALQAILHSTLARPYTFDNGVTISHPHESQVRRYGSGGALHLHEPEEERWFIHLLFEAQAGSILLNVGAAAGYYALLALRYRPPISVVAINPHPAFQMELRENAAAAGIAVVNATGPNDDLAILRRGGILQLGCALAERAQTGFMGGGYGSGIMSQASQASRDVEVREARKKAKQWLQRNSSRSNELVGRVVPVQSVSLSDIFGFLCAGPAGARVKHQVNDQVVDSVSARTSTSLCAVYLATFDIQGFEERVFATADTHELLRTHRIERVIVGTHSHTAHRAVLDALALAQYRILYNATAVAGQPDGMVIALSPKRRRSRWAGVDERMLETMGV